MNPSLSQEVTKIINEVAKMLEVPVNQLIQTLYKQAQYNFIMDVAWIVISIVIITGTVLFVRWCFKNCEFDDIYFVALSALLIASAVFTIVLLVCASEMVQIKVNPDYHVFEIVKRLTK